MYTFNVRLITVGEIFNFLLTFTIFISYIALITYCFEDPLTFKKNDWRRYLAMVPFIFLYVVFLTGLTAFTIEERMNFIPSLTLFLIGFISYLPIIYFIFTGDYESWTRSYTGTMLISLIVLNLLAIPLSIGKGNH